MSLAILGAHSPRPTPTIRGKLSTGWHGLCRFFPPAPCTANRLSRNRLAGTLQTCWHTADLLEHCDCYANGMNISRSGTEVYAVFGQLFGLLRIPSVAIEPLRTQGFPHTGHSGQCLRGYPAAVYLGCNRIKTMYAFGR